MKNQENIKKFPGRDALRILELSESEPGIGQESRRKKARALREDVLREYRHEKDPLSFMDQVDRYMAEGYSLPEAEEKAKEEKEKKGLLYKLNPFKKK